MKEKINFKWWDKSWNPMSGCTPVSEACENCYANRIAHHYPDAFAGKENPFAVKLYPERLDQPRSWRKPRFIFVCDMGDLYHEDVPLEFIEEVFAKMSVCTHHTFAVLTKRVQRMADHLKSLNYWCKNVEKYFPNVWLGTTAENQQRADERIPVLLGIPAARRFVSVEPMLGPVDLFDYLRHPCGSCNHPGNVVIAMNDDGNCGECNGSRFVKTLDWVICGGESGPHARPMDPDWARSLRDQCQAAGVKFWFKQRIVSYKKYPDLDGVIYHDRP